MSVLLGPSIAFAQEKPFMSIIKFNVTLGDFVYLVIKPAHDKKPTIRLVQAAKTRQPAHPRRLIRFFADCMCLLQPPGYPKRDKRESLPHWVGVQAGLSLCWSHRSYCRFCRALAQF